MIRKEGWLFRKVAEMDATRKYENDYIQNLILDYVPGTEGIGKRILEIKKKHALEDKNISRKLIYWLYKVFCKNALDKKAEVWYSEEVNGKL